MRFLTPSFLAGQNILNILSNSAAKNLAGNWIIIQLIATNF